MKASITALMIAVSCAAMPAHAVDFWHSSTVWISGGQCSAVFTFDSGMEEVRNLQVSVDAFSKSRRKVASGVLEVSEFGESSATRYADAFLEGEAVCDDGLTIVVNKATALIDGRRVDLLKSKTITARDFKPFKVIVGKKI